MIKRKYWDRSDTQDWIALLESRIEDMHYYKNEAQKWCEKNNVINFELVTKCLITTCIWVAHMRQEDISLGEIYDLIGVIDINEVDASINQVNFDHVIEFRDGAGDFDLEHILEELVKEETKN